MGERKGQSLAFYRADILLQRGAGGVGGSDDRAQDIGETQVFDRGGAGLEAQGADEGLHGFCGRHERLHGAPQLGGDLGGAAGHA